MLLFCKYTAYRVSHCITEYHWQSQSKDWPRQKESWIYDVIISFTEVAVATFGPFRLSLMSLRKTERFWVKRSLFFVNKVLSIPSIRFSNLQKIVLKRFQGGQTKSDQVIMAALLSACWEAITWSRKFWWKKDWLKKYFHCIPKDHLEVVLIEEDKAQQGPAHAPLVPDNRFDEIQSYS